jgi:hypothetical protein
MAGKNKQNHSVVKVLGGGLGGGGGVLLQLPRHPLVHLLRLIADP